MRYCVKLVSSPNKYCWIVGASVSHYHWDDNISSNHSSASERRKISTEAIPYSVLGRFSVIPWIGTVTDLVFHLCGYQQRGLKISFHVQYRTFMNELVHTDIGQSNKDLTTNNELPTLIRPDRWPYKLTEDIPNNLNPNLFAVQWSSAGLEEHAQQI